MGGCIGCNSKYPKAQVVAAQSQAGTIPAFNPNKKVAIRGVIKYPSDNNNKK